jgi:hypothetical protein
MFRLQMYPESGIYMLPDYSMHACVAVCQASKLRTTVSSFRLNGHKSVNVSVNVNVFKHINNRKKTTEGGRESRHTVSSVDCLRTRARGQAIYSCMSNKLIFLIYSYRSE